MYHYKIPLPKKKQNILRDTPLGLCLAIIGVAFGIMSFVPYRTTTRIIYKEEPTEIIREKVKNSPESRVRGVLASNLKYIKPEVKPQPVKAKVTKTNLSGLSVTQLKIEIEKGAKPNVTDYMIELAGRYGVDASKIIQNSKKSGVDYRKILVTLYCESGFNPKTSNSIGNSAGTDRGIAMFNNYYKSYVSDQCAYDWKCATDQFIKEVKAGKLKHWYGYKTKKAERIKTKLGI